MWTMNFWILKLDLEKAEEPEIKLPTSTGSSKSQRIPEKHLFYWLLQSLRLWLSTTNCGKFFKIWEYQTALTASWEICMQVKKQQLELDIEQQTGSKLCKEHVKAVYCHPAYLTYISCKMPGCMNTSRIKIARRNISNLRYTDDTTTYDRKWRKTKGPLDESERKEWKSWLKTQHSKN